jgi:hypothetical protein
MTIALTTIGVAIAAFCVSLGVRIVNRTWKPTWRFWACIVLIAMLYVASSGPAPVIAYRGRFRTTDRFDSSWSCYRPLAWIGRQPWGEPIRWYWDFFPLP